MVGRVAFVTLAPSDALVSRIIVVVHCLVSSSDGLSGSCKVAFVAGVKEMTVPIVSVSCGSSDMPVPFSPARPPPVTVV